MKQNKILIVDDEPNHLKSIQRLFNDSGYLLAFAESGTDALAIIEQFEPDLAILDVRMPGMDGYQLCRHIKSGVKRRGTMVLMLSGCADASDRLAGYRVEADDYLTKPYDSKELKAKVNILLRLKNAQDRLRDLNRSLGQLVRKRTRELMEKEYEAMVGRMVQGIAHNLRGPLTAIHGNTELAELLIQQFVETESASIPSASQSLREVSDLHGTVKRIVDQAKEMLTDLLARSRNEAALNHRELNLNEVIREEMTFLDADRDIGGGVLRKVLLNENLPPIRGNHSDFSQLVYNMVKNAAEAMADMPLRELTVATDMDENHLKIIFRDTGPGISPENRRRIFDLYFTTKRKRSDDTVKRSSGNGIGLYTCDQIVRSYGGEIRVAGEPGIGTTFTILIPRENEACSADIEALLA